MSTVARVVVMVVTAAGCRPTMTPPDEGSPSRGIHVEILAERGRQPRSTQWSGVITCGAGDRHTVGSDDYVPGREWWIRWPHDCAQPAQLWIDVDINWLSCDPQQAADTIHGVVPNSQVVIKVAACDGAETSPDR